MLDSRLLNSILTSRSASGRQLEPGGSLSLAPAQILVQHPHTRDRVPAYLVSNWLLLRGPSNTLVDLGESWLVARPGLYPSFEALGRRFHRGTSTRDTYLYGDLIPMSTELLAHPELPFERTEYGWGAWCRERYRELSIDVVGLVEVSRRFQRFDLAQVVVGVAGRRFKSGWLRGLYLILVFYPTHVLMLHSPHPSYSPHLHRWIQTRSSELSVDDDTIVALPYAYDSHVMRSERGLRRFPPPAPVSLRVLGLQDHPAAEELEELLGVQLIMRGHLNLTEIPWEHLTPDLRLPSADVYEQLWGPVDLLRAQALDDLLNDIEMDSDESVECKIDDEVEAAIEAEDELCTRHDTSPASSPI